MAPAGSPSRTYEKYEVVELLSHALKLSHKDGRKLRLLLAHFVWEAVQLTDNGEASLQTPWQRLCFQQPEVLKEVPPNRAVESRHQVANLCRRCCDPCLSPTLEVKRHLLNPRQKMPALLINHLRVRWHSHIAASQNS